jgi:hypothetical protein
MYALSRRSVLTSAALALTLVASRADAQAIYGAAELDTDDVAFFMLGGSWNPPGLGWKPLVSVTAFHLRVSPGATTFTRNVVLPSVGVINMQPDQSLMFAVGYAFSDDEVDDPLTPGLPVQQGEGVVGSFGWDYWGTTGRRAAQLLAAYNFGTEFLWTRGRASLPLTATSPLWVGGELALFGGGSPSVYIAQLGPTIEYRFTPKFRVGASAGVKFGVSNAEGFGAPAYGRLEFLWLPAAP